MHVFHKSVRMCIYYVRLCSASSCCYSLTSVQLKVSPICPKTFITLTADPLCLTYMYTHTHRKPLGGGLGHRSLRLNGHSCAATNRKWGCVIKCLGSKLLESKAKLLPIVHSEMQHAAAADGMKDWLQFVFHKHHRHCCCMKFLHEC